MEIGGSFRLPEIFEVSGATLREVGTTNITRLSDYARAINSETAAILRVHRSNFRLVGFAEDVALGDLVSLAREKGLWMIDDIGSGALAMGRPPMTAMSRPRPIRSGKVRTSSSFPATNCSAVRSAASLPVPSGRSGASKPTP